MEKNNLFIEVLCNCVKLINTTKFKHFELLNQNFEERETANQQENPIIRFYERVRKTTSADHFAMVLRAIRLLVVLQTVDGNWVLPVIFFRPNSLRFLFYFQT